MWGTERNSLSKHKELSVKARKFVRSIVLGGFLAMSLGMSAQTASLKDAYEGCFLVGAALNPPEFTGEKNYELIKTQFNAISPENVLKWEIVHPQPDKYAFTLADQYVEFGVKNHMEILGHNLVWHSQTPKWVFEDEKGKPLTRDALLQRMREHIQTVVGRYKGKIDEWDVVNEALNEDGTMRQSQWMKIIGPDYIQKAFEYAHEADPKAQLEYNDYNLENPAKREGAIKIVKELKEKGIQIDAVGLQDHFDMEWAPVSDLDATISDFEKLGVKVRITELDVDLLPKATQQQTSDVSVNVASDPKLNPYPNGLPAEMQQKLATRYADLFSTYAKHCGEVTRVTFWGVTDADSWKNGWPVRGRTNYPLLFDREGKPKPAFQAVIAAAPKKK